MQLVRDAIAGSRSVIYNGICPLYLTRYPANFTGLCGRSDVSNARTSARGLAKRVAASGDRRVDDVAGASCSREHVPLAALGGPPARCRASPRSGRGAVGQPNRGRLSALTKSIYRGRLAPAGTLGAAGERVACRAQATARLIGFSQALVRQRAVTTIVLLAPLAGEHGSRGVLLRGRRTRQALLASSTSSCSPPLQEPMAVALDNDARLHELAALREAAEADRQSLAAPAWPQRRRAKRSSAKTPAWRT